MKLSVIALFAGLSIMSAQQPASPARVLTKHFQKLDADRDGRISLMEFQAVGKDPAKRAKRFHRLDLNQDGYLSFDEFAAGRAAHAK